MKYTDETRQNVTEVCVYSSIVFPGIGNGLNGGNVATIILSYSAKRFTFSRNDVLHTTRSRYIYINVSSRIIKRGL